MPAVDPTSRVSRSITSVVPPTEARGTELAAGRQALAVGSRVAATEAEAPQTAKVDAAVVEAVAAHLVDLEAASVAHVVPAGAEGARSEVARKVHQLHQREASHKHHDSPQHPPYPPSDTHFLRAC